MDVNGLNLNGLLSQLDSTLGLGPLSQQQQTGTVGNTNTSTSNSTTTSTDPSLSLSNDAQNMKTLGIDPNSLQTALSYSSFQFSFSQLFANMNVNANGAADFQAQQMNFNFSVQSLNAQSTGQNGSVAAQGFELTFSLQITGVEQQTAPANQQTSTPVPGDFQKQLESILKNIQNGQNGQNGQGQDSLGQSLKGLLSALQPLLDFLFKFGQAQSGNPQTPFDQNKGNQTLAISEQATIQVSFESIASGSASNAQSSNAQNPIAGTQAAA